MTTRLDELEARLREQKAFFRNGAAWLMSPEPDPDCIAAADTIAALRRERDEAYATVKRVWKALGCESYEDARGMEISELAADMRRERDEARCPIGLDDAHEICSAGCCFVCIRKRLSHMTSRAEAAEAQLTEARAEVERLTRERDEAWG